MLAPDSYRVYSSLSNTTSAHNTLFNPQYSLHTIQRVLTIPIQGKNYEYIGYSSVEIFPKPLWDIHWYNSRGRCCKPLPQKKQGRLGFSPECGTGETSETSDISKISEPNKTGEPSETSEPCTWWRKQVLSLTMSELTKNTHPFHTLHQEVVDTRTIQCSLRYTNLCPR